ncbi:MAG TPA: VOC family protein [Solirubrobacteraceae bacterium]|nr:VOC family protein [Solirubrobacteraceae bacterium]
MPPQSPGGYFTARLDGRDVAAVAPQPVGAVFCAWEPRRHRGAQLVNQHGSVNFNDLHTPDREGAKAFYGAVFGWETLEMDGGFAMWTLPGYGDHLEQDDPELRARNRELGAPEGFADVVASLAPIADDGTPPHRGVTFAVDDADAIAVTAAERGGTVVVAPMDAPWVRMTVIADPQGATFVASRFMPENSSLIEDTFEAGGAARS